MISKTLKQGLAVAVGLLPLAAVAQHTTTPPTPGGFKTRGGGSSYNVTPNVTPPSTMPSKAGLTQALHARIQGLIRTQHYDEAETATMELIQRDPTSQYTQFYLRQIQVGRAALEAPLRQMIVPEVNFREASLPDVVKFLSDVSGQLSRDKQPVSFILQVPPGVATPAVSLSLRNVPMIDVLRYATAAAGLNFKVEPHAVVIYKLQPPAAKPAGPGEIAPAP